MINNIIILYYDYYIVMDEMFLKHKLYFDMILKLFYRYYKLLIYKTYSVLNLKCIHKQNVEIIVKYK